MQIVGASCAICRETIRAVMDGVHCPSCKAAFHFGCQSRSDVCPSCHADLTAARETERRKELADPSKITSGKDLSYCCIQCGSVEVAAIRSITLTYVPKWSWYFIATGFFWLPLYYYLRRTATLTIGLCGSHRRRQQLFRFLGYALVIIGPALIAIGVQSERLSLQVVGAALLVTFLPVVRFATPVVVTYIDGNAITLAARHNNVLQATCEDARA